MFIFLDESGDLGFDFTRPGPTRYFVVTLLVLPSDAERRRLEVGVARTLRHKVRRGKARKLSEELKGSSTSFPVKLYFWRQVAAVDFGLYAIALNKRRVHVGLHRRRERLYNYLARLLLERVPFRKVLSRVTVIVDRRKAAGEFAHFTRYVEAQLAGLVPPHVPVTMYQEDSRAAKGIQAADLFAWGFFQKYERGVLDWYRVFGAGGKIRSEVHYLVPETERAP